MPSSLFSISIGQGSAIFTTPAQSPLGRLWRTAGCGHLRSDAPKHARRCAGSIIDCQNCVTCIAPNKRALRWQWAGGRNKQHMVHVISKTADMNGFQMLLCYLSLLSRWLVLQHVRRCWVPTVRPQFSLSLAFSLSVWAKKPRHISTF